MPMFFRHKSKRAFGLDVSDISLKLIELGPAQSGHIAAFGDLPIPKGVLAGDAVKDPKFLIKIIRQAVAQPKFGRITTPYVIASIPETKSFVRVIQMPRLTEEEAATAVPLEAEAYIPMPIGQVYLDWMILPAPTGVPGPTSPARLAEGEEKMTVLITASPKDYVDDFTKILKEAGLKALALEVESQATARSLTPDDGEAVLIADINTVRTSLIIYEKNTLQFTSSIPIAGNIFTETIARVLGLDAEKAEELKREFGLSEDAERGLIKKALVPVLSNLVLEIKNTIHFYEEHSSGKITKLLLSGGSSKLKHLPSFLAEKLRQADSKQTFRSLPAMKVELGNPWIRVLSKKKSPPISREDSLSFATAIGLALRGEDV